MLKSLMINHGSRNTRLYIRYSPGSPKFQFRMDLGIPGDRSVEGEISLCDEYPKTCP